jgi:hypothetical protein
MKKKKYTKQTWDVAKDVWMDNFIGFLCEKVEIFYRLIKCTRYLDLLMLLEYVVSFLTILGQHSKYEYHAAHIPVDHHFWFQRRLHRLRSSVDDW